MAPLTYFVGQTLDNIPSWNIEFINIVITQSYLKYNINNNADTATFRTSGNVSVNNVRFLGVYFAPSFREIGSKAHTDKLQFSGGSAYSNIQIENSIFFGSTNSVAQVGAAINYNFIQSLIIGSNITCVRYTVLSGADGYSVGYVTPNGVNIDAINATAIDSILIGSIGATHWAFQQPATGSKWIVDPSLLTINRAWIDARVPYPTNDYLQQVFNNSSQFAKN